MTIVSSQGLGPLTKEKKNVWLCVFIILRKKTGKKKSQHFFVWLLFAVFLFFYFSAREASSWATRLATDKRHTKHIQGHCTFKPSEN